MTTQNLRSDVYLSLAMLAVLLEKSVTEQSLDAGLVLRLTGLVLTHLQARNAAFNQVICGQSSCHYLGFYRTSQTLRYHCINYYNNHHHLRVLEPCLGRVVADGICRRRGTNRKFAMLLRHYYRLHQRQGLKAQTMSQRPNQVVWGTPEIQLFRLLGANQLQQ